MLRQYYEENKKLIKEEIKLNEQYSIVKGSWIEVINPSKEEISWLENDIKIPKEFIISALDDEESAHINVEENSRLIIIDAPIRDGSYYTTTPFAIIHDEEHIITISNKETDLVKSLFLKNKKIEPHKRVRITLMLLYSLATSYIQYLKKIDNQAKDIETKLHKSMKNTEIFSFMELSKSLVYFSTALNANKIIVHKLIRTNEFKKYEEDLDLLEDTEIEINQAIEMCSIYRDILNGRMDAYSSIIANNLNIVMKTLAVLTIVLEIPTLIASFFGMNFVNIPFDNSKIGFYIIVIVSFIISAISAILLYRFTTKNKTK